MMPMPQERAAGAVAAYRRSGDLGALEKALASQFAEAVEDERRGLRTTLGLCAEVLNQVLDLRNVPGDLRAAVRACRGLCLAGLGEGPREPTAGETRLEPSAPPYPWQR
jgi:hypothetical protein